MKNHLHDDMCLCRPASSRQSTEQVIVALDPTAIVGFVGPLASLNL